MGWESEKMCVPWWLGLGRFCEDCCDSCAAKVQGRRLFPTNQWEDGVVASAHAKAKDADGRVGRNATALLLAWSEDEQLQGCSMKTDLRLARARNGWPVPSS